MQFTEEQRAELIQFNSAIISQYEAYAVPVSEMPLNMQLMVSSARIALACLRQLQAGVSAESEAFAALKMLFAECDTGERRGNGSMVGVAKPTWVTAEMARLIIDRLSATASEEKPQ